MIAGVTLIYLIFLHKDKDGSNNPIGSDSEVDDVLFYSYFYFVSKDIFALSCFLVFFAIFIFYFPNTFNHPDNYIPADSLQTPVHVIPEWYFLPFYAILRSILHKVGGILAMGGTIVVLLLIFFINTSYVRNAFIFVGQVAIVYYIFFFILKIFSNREKIKEYFSKFLDLLFRYRFNCFFIKVVFTFHLFNNYYFLL